MKIAISAAAVILALLVGNAWGAGTHPATVDAEAAPRVCFSAASWSPAPDRIRPCVRITRLFEDGSFSVAVTDADGTVRYTTGVGALDR